MGGKLYLGILFSGEDPGTDQACGGGRWRWKFAQDTRIAVFTAGTRYLENHIHEIVDAALLNGADARAVPLLRAQKRGLGMRNSIIIAGVLAVGATAWILSGQIRNHDLQAVADERAEAHPHNETNLGRVRRGQPEPIGER